MNLLSEPSLSGVCPCPYFDDRPARFTYFFANDLTYAELDTLLYRGWRKFGIYYFRPSCSGCAECIPIRVVAEKLLPSKSQRRVLKNCRDVRVEFRELEYRDELFRLYEDHSLNRFGRTSNQEEFLESFYTRSCPTVQSEYYLDGKLIAAGFLDVSSSALSSIYFFFGNDYSKLKLGTFSTLKETEQALSMGLKYYYLGYYIRENPRMSYKNNFYINEKMDWATGEWSAL